MANKITTDFAGNETLEVTKTRIGEIVAAYGYDSSGYSTWGDARGDLNDALTLASQSTIGATELASSFRPKLNFLNTDGSYNIVGLRPELVLDFEEEYYRADAVAKTFPNAITHTRASTATYVDSTGTLQTAAINEPRLGHHVWNGTAWVNEGLLHESEARTNLLTYSEEFDNAYWTKSRTTISANATAAPDGQTTGDKLVEDATLGRHEIASSTVTASPSTFYTASFFAKSDEITEIQVNFSNVTLGGNIWGFDLVNVAATQPFSAGAGWSSVSASISDFGNGWRRIVVSGLVSAEITAVRLDIRLMSGGSNTYTGDGTSGVFLWGAQLEAAPTPSSYIPTAGTTVTRSADVLTIPAANLPYPEPVVIGPELVTNGTFDTDTSNWTAQLSAVLTWTSGQLRVESTGANSLAFQNVPLTVGKVYELAYDISQEIAGSASFGVSVAGRFFNTANANGTNTVIFVATATSQKLDINPGTNGTARYDNISVREINPLALSIQMDGRVTYADTGAGVAVDFVAWDIDIFNKIKHYLDTQGTKTGAIAFQQANLADFDTVFTSDTYLSPDVLVPYSIAGRHGSTFINGAVDGTALTANLTPKALPDLSSRNLSLGNTYNGTIRTFRVWAQDVTDAGLIEATT